MRAAWIDIDLDAYRSNIRALRELCGTPVLAVVKANAYGHGLVPVARAAIEAGVWGFGVALPEEGAALRSEGIRGRIVVLGLTLPEHAREIVASKLECVVSNPEGVAALSDAARAAGSRLGIHVKVDTGMCRVGIEPECALSLCEAVMERRELQLAGVATHIACADSDPAATRGQWARFKPVIQAARARAENRPLMHAANSAAAIWFPETRLDLIRPGLLTYGVPPGGRSLPFEPSPALSLHGRVTQLKWVNPGSAVGYGGTFITSRRTLLGVVPIGYGDGLPWRLSNRGEALILGRRAPVVGRVSMDQVTLDLTGVPAATIGDVATFIGRQGSEEITASNLAAAAGTIPYEILTGLSTRLPRVYLGTIE